MGQVTLLNFADLHAQLMPIYFREPRSTSASAIAGCRRTSSARSCWRAYRIAAGTAAAYALACADFEALARTYGRIGGLDRLATLIKAIRAERGDKVLLLDGGDTWQGSYTRPAEQGRRHGADHEALGPDAMTAHWEFTYGASACAGAGRASSEFPFLAGNVKDATWGDPVFQASAVFERGGLRDRRDRPGLSLHAGRQPALPDPDWSFGIEEERCGQRREAARRQGRPGRAAEPQRLRRRPQAGGRVKGIDVILTGHTHDALPAPVKVGDTLLVAAGSHGKFLARLDLEVRDRRSRTTSSG